MRVSGGGVDFALGRLAPAGADLESSPRREAFVAALNGVVGDHLAASANPLAIPMGFRTRGRPLGVDRLPAPTRKLLLLVHGLCMNDLQWTRPAHDHGAELARALGYTTVHLHYNTGRHVSTNGREMSEMLEALVAAWPVPLDDVTIVAHSMGGLVARSAHHYGTVAGRRWTGLLRNLVFLGTPHHGTPLERGGHRFHLLAEKTAYTAPFARLGRIRSAGITDLRHGNLVDEVWAGRDRFARGVDGRRPVPLPDGVRCFTVAATLGTSPGGSSATGSRPSRAPSVSTPIRATRLPFRVARARRP
jgi:pimeloyl-ACP methyl ester carboxylesterase